ncbi:MAG: ABC transporter ATP-binding protein [Deltaproteobacteria bacterium]|nr:ABC transporter ATP-binding protein [Deltaproteobacteria bacterium]
MLTVDRLEVRYQELRALRGVSLEVTEGDLAALIGSNGAGKTTLLNTISGLVAAAGGRIEWLGESILGLAPDDICRNGIIQVPEGRKLFAKMSVEENLAIGAYLPKARAGAKDSMVTVFELFPIIAQRRKQMAGSLSGGEQQMVALARAMMAKPKLLMLDEPTLGLAPIIAADIFRIVADLNNRGLSVLLVSQEVLQTLNTARTGYVLENGKIALSGPSKGLLDDPGVKTSYLGL